MPSHRDLPDNVFKQPRKRRRWQVHRGVRHRGYVDSRRSQQVIGLVVVALVVAAYYTVTHPWGPFKFLSASPGRGVTPQVEFPGVSSTLGGRSGLHGEATLLLPVGPAQPVTGAAAIADLNQQRRVNGLAPLSVVKQSLASAWCPDEDHGPSAGESYRDLSQSLDWDATMTPWDAAPIHQISLYDPLVTAAGATDVGSNACLGLGDLATAPATPTFYAYTATTGRNDVPPVELVSGERPYAPQQLVGLAQGQPTGPQLIVYAEGFPGESWQAPVRVSWVRLQTAGGRGVSGVRFVDSRVAAGHAGHGLFGDAAVIIAPELRQATVYTLSVAWRGPAGQTRVQRVTFATGKSPGLRASLEGGAIDVSSRSPQPIYMSAGARGHAPYRRAVLRRGRATVLSFQRGIPTALCLYQQPGRRYTAGSFCFGLTYPANAEDLVSVR
jgi:hypothetical protein